MAFSISSVPPVSDRTRARRVLEELPEAITRDAKCRALIESAAGNSPYLARLAVREGAFLAGLFSRGPDAVLNALCADAFLIESENEESAAMAKLRAAKRRAALAIALADIGGTYDLAQVTCALSRFADAGVRGALRFALAEEARREGMDAARDWEPESGLIVLAMGKLGAFELNYSSDIDLVIFYRAGRFPFARAGDKRTAAIAIAQELVKLLSEVTSDGYVFRTDLRLRPDAGATQIAISTAAAEAYYEGMGQNWERAAMIKARQCAGDMEAGQAFLKTLEPFVWRKNLDYAAIQDIHSIKRQIHAYSGHSRIALAGHNIKLGRGGIREIEFFVQTQQLIAGGRDASLREAATRAALRVLNARRLISAEAERDLSDAYVFLRTLEHRLQMVEDQQTHTLPKTREGLDHSAQFMGYADTALFEADLLAHLRKVQTHYARLFERETPLGAEKGALVFTGVENDPETVATLSRMGFARAADMANVIRCWHHGRIRATRSARARELLTKLAPALLAALSATPDPDSAFAQFDRFLSGLPAGVQVFSLLLANPELLRLLAGIAGSAPRLAGYLGRHPGVLDALLDPDFFEYLPMQEPLAAKFAGALTRASGYEAALDAARRFAKEEMFRVGVQVIEGLARAGEAGPAFAAIAETVISGLQSLVEAQHASVHGRLPGAAFAVVAQGKLGGREMTAASDLDLVFLYAHDQGARASDGNKPLGCNEYFTRLAQRFLAALTALTAEGGLYEVDMRLRPSGRKGPVAVHIDTFASYHGKESWTWERMALTKARVLSGPPALRAAAGTAMRHALTRTADSAVILADARAMRMKMRRQYPGSDPWDLKHAPGGLVDIEFVAQALQLCHAPAGASVLDQNTVFALEKLRAVGVLSATQAAELVDAALLQRALTQALCIALDGPLHRESSSPGLRALLARAGGETSFERLEARLLAAQKRAADAFETIISA
ncbi:MAG: bifunctional [glutamine synthetase] adenylyltransferase/[glutamine synthetase]-adenylyl-L-tyrosine phosphorylase [Alphaproteobacteria bacterium]